MKNLVILFFLVLFRKKIKIELGDNLFDYYINQIEIRKGFTGDEINITLNEQKYLWMGVDYSKHQGNAGD